MKDIADVFQQIAQIRMQDILIEENKTGMIHNGAQISLLERALVIVKEGVDAHNMMIEREQRFSEMGPNKARDSGNQ